MPRRTYIPPPEEQELWQIHVTEDHPRWGRRTIAVGPRATKDFCGVLMETISKHVLSGQEKQWGMPWLERVTRAAVLDSPFTREDRQNELVGGYRSEILASTPMLTLPN